MSRSAALSIVLVSLAATSVASAQTTATPGRARILSTAAKPSSLRAPRHVGEAASLSAGEGCAISIRDQARPDACIEASSTPTLGTLFPYPGLNNSFSASAGSLVAGGADNTATGESTVAGGKSNLAHGRIAGYFIVVTEPSFVGGGRNNTARGGATIAGGSRNTAGYGLYSRFATIGGGVSNEAYDSGTTIGGGVGNSARGYWSTIAGGRNNAVREYYGTVGGGIRNTAGGTGSTVGGGYENHALGAYATVPGGNSNSALGDFSFAAGRQAKANHDGAFVWGDSGNGAKPSSAPDEFNVYAGGGARIFSSSDGSTGVLLAPGGGSWSSVSDRASKENFTPVSSQAVLEAVVALPISTWNYREQHGSIRHMGPMAQDFYEAFGLGVSDRLIDTVDPDGVALAAIQGLNEKLETENAELRAELAALREQVATLVAVPASR